MKPDCSEVTEMIQNEGRCCNNVYRPGVFYKGQNACTPQTEHQTSVVQSSRHRRNDTAKTTRTWQICDTVPPNTVISVSSVYIWTALNNTSLGGVSHGVNFGLLLQDTTICV